MITLPIFLCEFFLKIFRTFSPSTCHNLFLALSQETDWICMKWESFFMGCVNSLKFERKGKGHLFLNLGHQFFCRSQGSHQRQAARERERNVTSIWKATNNILCQSGSLWCTYYFISIIYNVSETLIFLWEDPLKLPLWFQNHPYFEYLKLTSLHGENCTDRSFITKYSKSYSL